LRGGKQRTSRTKPSSSRAAAALRLAASSLYHSHSALGAFHRRLKARLGAPKAITATAHKLACLIYRMLRFGTDYVDRGQDYYERRHQAGSSPISCAGLTNSATPSPGLKVPRHLPWRPREEVTWKKSTSATCNEGREFLFLAA